MRVLHVFKTYLPDSFTGVERVIWEIAEGAAGFGIRSHVFYLSEKSSASPIRIGGHWAHTAKRNFEIASTPFSLGGLARFKALAGRADIIHYHFPWPQMDVFHLLSNMKTLSVVTYHSDVVRQKKLFHFYRPIMHRFLNSVDRIVATSPNYVASSEILQKYSNKINIIPIGLDPSKLPGATPERMAFWKEKLPPRFFLFLGAPRYYKGLPFLMDAAKRSGLPVVFAGAGVFDTTRCETLTFLGKVSDEDKAALLELCEAFVFPSHLRSESFGVALLEAAFAGKAMISCEIGTGTSYVNAHGVTGLVVPPADSAGLAEAMTALWANPQQTRAYGEAARERAHQLFSARHMVESYRDVYRDLVRNRIST